MKLQFDFETLIALYVSLLVGQPIASNLYKLFTLVMYNQLSHFKKHTALQRRRLKNGFCFLNFKKYLKETTLHGLRFVGDESITIWERFFFFSAIIAALVATTQLISYLYAKWESTPIIIGVNPYPTLISNIPFPAITICNMNQLLQSKVSNYSKGSFEAAMIDMACFSELTGNRSAIPDNYKNNNLSLAEFFAKNGQSCENMLLSCELNSEIHNCSNLFRDTLADEGLCCVFNSLHFNFEMKKAEWLPNGAVPVNWNPESGYPKKLPDNYYPVPASGIGVSMGLSLVLNAEIDEYFCSSANGAGFKLALDNPIETPRVKENGIIIGVGVEARYTIDAHNTVAAPNIRNLQYSARNCRFADEGDLIHYKYYTRRNCENECSASYIYRVCNCIPFNLPLLYPNASVCGAAKAFCVNEAQNVWLRSQDSACRRRCLNNCFDYKYVATTTTTPLVQGNYTVQNARVLGNMSRKYIRENIVVVHFLFREFVFYGNTRNVYVGFTEFLSNIGGILSLFLGFSFISLAELFYYACMRPFFCWLQRRRIGSNRSMASMVETPDTTIWLGNELQYIRREPIPIEATLWNRWSYRQYKNELLKIQMKRFYAASIGDKPKTKLQDVRKGVWA